MSLRQRHGLEKAGFVLPENGNKLGHKSTNPATKREIATKWDTPHLSGPLDRLNVILSLLQPLDRYRTPSAIGSAIGRPYLALYGTQKQAGALNRLVLNNLEEAQPRDCGAIVSKMPLKKAIGAAILNAVLNRD